MAQYGGYGNQSGYGQTNNRYDEPAGNSYGQPAANPYGQAAANPYGQQATNPYGQQSGNPYGATQSANPYSQPQSNNPYAAPSGNTYDEEQSMGGSNNNNSNAIPMNNLNGGAAAHGQQKRQDPRAILNDCLDLNQAIDKLDRGLVEVEQLQGLVLNDPDSSQNSPNNRHLSSLSTEFQNEYEELVKRLGRIKATPGASQPANKSHIEITQTKLREAMQHFRTVDRKFQTSLREQIRRHVQIIMPDASKVEIEDAVNTGTSGDIFARKLMQSDRRGQSQSALRAVEERSAIFRGIEKSFEEVGSLIQELSVQIYAHDEVVQKINESAEEANNNVSQGNTQLDGAITKARAANRKKWYCLGIAILIILVIVIIVVVVVEVLKNK